MPGIAGIFSHSPNPENLSLLRSMVGSMLHESFYTSGAVAEDSLGIYAGWVCHRGSFSDCQAIWNESRDICLIFSGEHYADSTENLRLRAAGHKFSDDDASCLVHLYEEDKTEFFKILNGTFSGVIFDLRDNKVLLFNDRYGLGRVYVHENRSGLYFASEAKALLRVLPDLRHLDMRGLGELLVCGCTLQDRSLFPGISLLPTGSIWTLSKGKPIRKETYFDRTDWEARALLSPEDYYAALKDRFDRVLPRYFRGRQQVALSLTGGLDSRMIIAGAEAAPGELPCYTFGGMYRDSEDVRIGRLVAGLCHQPYSVIPVDQTFFPSYAALAARCVYITDGAMDVTGSVGLYVNKLARDVAVVRMTGNYGSEILRENIAFKAARIGKLAFNEHLLPHLSAAARTYQMEKQGCRKLSFIAFKQVPWHHYARFAEENSQLTIRAPYLDNDLVPLAYQAPVGLLLNKQLAYRYTTDRQPALIGAPTDRGLLKIPTIVPKKLFEFSKELGPRAEYYFDYGMPNWLAKLDRMVAPLHLDRYFLGQQKYYHFRSWFRSSLAQQIKEVLLDPVSLSRPYVNRREVEAMVVAHTSGTANHTIEIQKLMTCELIHRELIERK